MTKDLFSLESYNYELPVELIAQVPAEPADSCKLLVVNHTQNNPSDYVFSDIINLISNSVIFFNNTKVLKSRIHLDNAVSIRLNWLEKNIKDWEIFFLRHIDNNSFEALVRPGKKFLPWIKILLDDKVFLIKDITKDWRIIEVDFDIEEFLDQKGQMPLPPYIEYSKEKELPYQPIFAQNSGSVASPTASLHFTQNVLEWLQSNWNLFDYVTLHIGLGTFKVVDSTDIRDYDIHTEMINIDKDLFSRIADYKISWKKIIATWTTATRVLESLSYLWVELQRTKNVDCFSQYVINFWNDLTQNISTNYVLNVFISWQTISFETKLFVFPWFEFKIIDKLITNFHLPKSSLLMLVSWFMWYENMRKAYEHAISHSYKFFSFGDAMFVEKNSWN